MKATIRSEMKKRLKPLTKDYIDAQSTLVFNRLFDLPQFQSSTGVSIYLSMGGEVNTQAALRKSFELGKKVFIPKITGKNSADMFMLRVDSMDAINAFDKNAWGIPEPSMDIIAANHCGTYCGQIDLVLLPGVAFDKNCGRVGHGKGYYDCFIDRLRNSNADQGRPPPVLIGLALDEQMIESAPIEEHDRMLDMVITPSNCYTKPEPLFSPVDLLEFVPLF